MHLGMDSGFTACVGLGTDRTGTIAVLGDVSGSMCSGKRIPLLQKGFRDLVRDRDDRPIMLAKWDSWIEFCEVCLEDSRGTVESSVDKWINALKHRGGNDMRYAIEQTMQRCSDITDCYVMSDGDVSPFVIDGRVVDCSDNVPTPSTYSSESKSSPYHGTDWATFRQRFKKTRFHFIAFDMDADVENMRKMAGIGGGTFTVMQ